MANYNKKIFNNMKKRRLMAGYTVIEVSEKIGVSRTTIYNFESGMVIPKRKNLNNLCKLYNCSVGDLF